ncbi:HAMP domain-containing sensor histidine kinase [Neobacillus sp. OS1-32]|jgi:signal transduction histidine kinase|uniref:sensor histidine kinase n=1 Tax=Neobacillus sp. OS1-32 TaxID=3070682 RepID=UPI0027E11B30|nr:HAMP domain-containing sensor histidine kinase [Neobacillus sp. OS1-32]WML31338.1 HAMP domain-containing sensor histidine kinase [Neobacillus sp. OS1-32]
MSNSNETEINYRELAEKYEAINRILEKRLEEEIRKNHEKDQIIIQHSRLAAMGEMMASIGHQWRQPLNSLLLLVQDVRDALEYGEINESYIDRFTRESTIQIKHMSQTIRDFRNFYKPNSEKTTFSVGDAIEDALSIYSLNLQNHGIKVEFENRGQQVAYGYPNEFSQIVLNILANARDAFIQKEIANRKIMIKINETTDFITAEFTDNAGGIDAAFLEKVFEPNFTTKPHGSGLGLYMAKTVIERMDGSVSVENVGNGAQFRLSIPKPQF